MVQGNQAKRRRKKTGHLLEWVKAIAPCLIIATIVLGTLRYFSDREKEVAVHFLRIVELLAHDSEVVRTGAVAAMEEFYEKYRDEASQVLAYHLATEKKALVRRAILNVLEQAEVEAIEPLAAASRLLAEENDWTVDSMKKSLEKNPLHDFRSDSFTENLSDIVTALATVLQKGGFPKDRELDLSKVILVNQSSQGFITLDLRQANLEKANLREACLITVSLEKANLREAKLVDTLLHNVDLTGASLEGATLSPVWSGWVILVGADLTDARLAEAFLRGADMKEAILVDARLPRADLSGANLTRANLQRAFLESATMEETILDEANLAGANLTEATLTDALLKGAKMEGATLKGADLRGANLIGATFDPRDIKEAKNWEKAIFDDSQRQKLGLTKINQ